jgi:hypothetical protein
MTEAEILQANDNQAPRIVRLSPTSLSQLDVWFNERVDVTSAMNLANWKLRDNQGAIVPITNISFHPHHADRVTLHATLWRDTGYTLKLVGSIYDRADMASGGGANATAASETHHFRVGSSITITLGTSGYENITIPVHDAAMVSSGLSTWNHNLLWLRQDGSNPDFTTGFVRFDRREAPAGLR